MKMNKQQFVNSALIIGTIIMCCAFFGIVLATYLEKLYLIWYCGYAIAIAAILFGMAGLVDTINRKQKRKSKGE